MKLVKKNDKTLQIFCCKACPCYYPQNGKCVYSNEQDLRKLVKDVRCDIWSGCKLKDGK